MIPNLKYLYDFFLNSGETCAGSPFEAQNAAEGSRESRKQPCPLPAAAMAFLGGWFKTDEDDIDALPDCLRNIYVNPWKVEQVGHSKTPLLIVVRFREYHIILLLLLYCTVCSTVVDSRISFSCS